MVQAFGPGVTFSLFLTLNLPATPVAAQDVGRRQTTDRSNRMAVMKELVGEIRVFETVDGEERELQRGEAPVTRYSDNARLHEDGTLWAFTRNDRPVALLTCNTKDASTQRWWHTVVSLTTNQIRGEQSGSTVWAPEGPGVDFRPVPNSLSPPATSALRRLKMRQVARRFDAHQFWNPDNQRFQLRLSPRPVLVYSDEAADILDGGLFLFTYGQNPALVLMIEAVGDENDASWRYAIAKNGSAEFHVSLDDDEVYQSPRAPGVVGRSIDPYFLFSSVVED